MTIRRKPPEANIAAFMAAIRADQCLLGDAARAAQLTLYEAAEVFDYGASRGSLKLHDEGPGLRWIAEVPL